MPTGLICGKEQWRLRLFALLAGRLVWLGELGRLRSSNCNSDTIGFAGASRRAVTYFTLSVGVILSRTKSS